MQKYSFLFKSQQLPLKNLTFVYFLTFVFMLLTRSAMEAPFSGFFGIRCRQCSPLFWYLQNSVPERASYGTEYACRAQKGFLRYATRFLKPSVLKTGFWGTEGIFGTGNALLRYATRFQRRETADSDTPPPLIIQLDHTPVRLRI